MLGGTVLSGGRTDVPNTKRRHIRVGLHEESLSWLVLSVRVYTFVFVDRCGREYCKREEQLSRVSFKPKEY